MSERIEPTVPPRRAAHAPRNGVPVPSTDPASLSEHWRKHPSDYHADCCMGLMGEAASQPDTTRGREIHDAKMREAELHAILSHRDAILEWVATLREVQRRRVP